ncbi:MAG TPA: twin-arginine translocase TatA/TatE family subunit [Acidimicrobiales bacterium]|nr:twin-arginine translocase TatA/TatE family subunit [Acidimicrobiales bacterium]
MGFLDPAKILVVLVLALIVLGPERLPKAARQLGAAWRELTRVRDQVTEEIRSAIPDLDLPNIPRLPTNMVSGFIADLTKPSVSGVGGEAAGDEGVTAEVDDLHDEVLSTSATGLVGDESATGTPSGPGAVPAVRSDAGGSARGTDSLAARSGASRAPRASTEHVPLLADDPSMN